MAHNPSLHNMLPETTYYPGYWSKDLGAALDMRHLLHVLDGVGSDHRGYNMNSAELFRNGQSKPEVLKESKE